MEAPREHTGAPHRAPARYLVTLDSGGYRVARLFLETREQVGEFDAAVEEVGAMVKNLVPQSGALGPEWDLALLGHSNVERAGAEVYTLDI